jgi:flagellar basal-body rod protein FlgG
MQSVFAAAQGLSAQQERIDTIANNISNVNTAAFKRANVSFKDALYTGMENPGGAEGKVYNLQKGTGIVLASSMLDFSQGTIESTGNNLDFAIEGDGFFQLREPDGSYVYTRDGSFEISVEEDGSYLVTEQGSYVMDQDGNKIRIPAGVCEMTVSEDGTLTFGTGEEAGETKFGIYTFPNASGLYSAGNGVYTGSPAAGDAEPAEAYRICRESLEGSNVLLADELTRLVRAQRMYSLASRALQTADDMEGLAINIR